MGSILPLGHILPTSVLSSAIPSKQEIRELPAWDRKQKVCALQQAAFKSSSCDKMHILFTEGLAKHYSTSFAFCVNPDIRRVRAHSNIVGEAVAIVFPAAFL